MRNLTSISGPRLPFKVANHCMLKLKNGSVLIIAGQQKNFVSQRMWTVDDVGSPDKFKLTKGPSLNQKRFSAACGEMLDYFGNTIYIVAGGRDKHGNNLETVEILNSTEMNQWMMGKLQSD